MINEKKIVYYYRFPLFLGKMTKIFQYQGQKKYNLLI